MRINPKILERCVLFDGILPEERAPMLGCLGSKVVSVVKNQFVFREGDPANLVGIVLEGCVQMVREDYYGNRSILARMGPAELFGEGFACADVKTFPISVVAVEDSQVLLIDSRRITVTCANACSFHNRMIFNMLKVVANKNLVLNQKIEITSRRTTREKLMAYLLTPAKLHNSDTFTIPYDRQALADYLEVERSAMSAEISKLRRDGIIECEKSAFRLLKPERIS